MFKKIYLLNFLLLSFMLACTTLYGADKFVLVLDAGHGGHDAGAIGRITKEKDINLGVILKLGNLIEDNFNDVKVVYTRNTDVFIPLQERADIANRNKSNLFVSVHTNAAKARSAYGAEVYTLGLAKSKANLDVAMTENSVILLEDDYKTKYKGFDPNSVESYIMFEFMQDKYLDQSLSFASGVQKNFVNNLKRYDRGVRQAGFWVLHRTASPSVLIELGFISNTEEENFLASEGGQRKMATAIYNSFVKFKREYDKMMGFRPNSSNVKELEIAEEPPTQAAPVAVENVTKTEENKPLAAATELPLFKVQFYTSPTKLSSKNKALKGVEDFDFYKEAGLFKYTVGSDTDFNKINTLRKNISKKFPDAFVIAFQGDKKLSLKEAMNLKR